MTSPGKEERRGGFGPCRALLRQEPSHYNSEEITMRGIALVSLLGFGCATTAVVRLSPAKYESRPAETPIALYSSHQPTCAFTEIAIVKARRDTWLVSRDAVLDALRNKARQLGGDAVVRVGFDENDAITGTVIRFEGQDCRQ